MRHLLFDILALSVLVAIFTSCNSDTCTQNRSTLPLAGFYDREGIRISVDSLAVYGIGGDVDSAIVAAPGTRITSVYLPMQPGTDHTTYVISYKQKELDFPQLNDTLSFQYTASPYFASNECGVVMYYHLKHMAYTTHLVEKVEVTDSTFNNVDIERLKIYFRTSKADTDNQPGEEAVE